MRTPTALPSRSVPEQQDSWTSDTSGLDALESHAGTAARCIDRLTEAAPVGLPLLRELRRRCAAVQGLRPLGPHGDRSDDGAGPAVVEFARQFATDVAGIDDESRSVFLAATGPDSFATVQAVWIADQVPRIRAVLDAVFGQSEWPELADGDLVPGDAWPAIDDFITTVHRLGSLDPVTSEVVRLRGARQHDCRLCRSLRSRPALLAGGDDELWRAIDQPSTLTSPLHRAALGLVDAMIWTPGRVPDQVVDDVRARLAPVQVVELVLDVARNGANKIAVALAADAPNVEDGIEVYEIDPDGTAHYGLAVPRS